jgi:hypothetical protein
MYIDVDIGIGIDIDVDIDIDISNILLLKTFSQGSCLGDFFISKLFQVIKMEVLFLNKTFQSLEPVL